MRAFAVHDPGPIDSHPLVACERVRPRPAPGEVLVEVSVCGVCRTDLHLAEGDLVPRRPDVVPGHEAVGRVVELGERVSSPAIGARVGVAWLARSCGSCGFCMSGRENLCLAPLFTGWDRDGGFAEYVAVDSRFCYPIPERFSDEEAAPLLCAGIIGYRALRRAALPPGGRLGIYGFGASAHICAQLALAEGARVHVITRSEGAQRLALELGASSAAGSDATPPEPLDSAILFAPAGELVPVALRALDRGGTLAVAGIYLSEIPPLDYASELFEERTLRSVTANTRSDGVELLEIASRIPLSLRTTSYPLDAATSALSDLAHDRFEGAAVLRVRD